MSYVRCRSNIVNNTYRCEETGNNYKRGDGHSDSVVDVINRDEVDGCAKYCQQAQRHEADQNLSTKAPCQTYGQSQFLKKKIQESDRYKYLN